MAGHAAASDILSDIALAKAANPGKHTKTDGKRSEPEVVDAASVPLNSREFIEDFAPTLKDSLSLRHHKCLQSNELFNPIF